MENLKSGDVIVVRSHDSFFALLNTGLPIRYKTAGPNRSPKLLENLVDSSNDATATYWRERILRVLTDPVHSRLSAAWCIIFSSAITLTEIFYVMESLPTCEGYNRCTDYYKANNWFTIFFTLEFVLRISCMNSLRSTVRGVYTWVDFLSLLPDYEEWVLHHKQWGTEFLHSLRLVRLITTFEFARESVELLKQTLKKSIGTLITIVIITCIASLGLAKIMYILEASSVDPITKLHMSAATYVCEYDESVFQTESEHGNRPEFIDKCQASAEDTSTILCPRLYRANEGCEKSVKFTEYQSLMHALWYVVMTMTTVGFGDMIPATYAGAVTAYVTMLTGTLAIAMPISVIASQLSITLKPNSGENI